MKTQDVFVGCPGLSHRNCTTGPLTLRQVDGSDIPRGSIPFLGDAAAVPGGFRLSAELSSRLEAGNPLTSSFGRGPASWNATTGCVELFSAPTPVPAAYLIPINFLKVGDVATVSDVSQLAPHPQLPLVLQDLRHWAALHRGRLQLLMGDGSVRQVIDQNGDGFINPGFPIERRANESPAETQQ